MEKSVPRPLPMGGARESMLGDTRCPSTKSLGEKSIVGGLLTRQSISRIFARVEFDLNQTQKCTFIGKIRRYRDFLILLL